MFPATVFLSGIYLVFPPFHHVVKQPWNGLPVPLDKSGARSPLCWLLTLNTHHSPASERKRVGIGLGTLALGLFPQRPSNTQDHHPTSARGKKIWRHIQKEKGSKALASLLALRDRDLMVTAGY